MNKRGIILSIVILSSLIALVNLVSADENQTQLDKAYQCIKNKVAEDCSQLTIEEEMFSLLGLGDYKNCKSSFLDNSLSLNNDQQQCWPKASCKVKDTAIAILALQRAGANTDKARDWLLNQSKVASDLVWYLQIESSQATTCNIKYDNANHNVNIQENKKPASGAGNCLSVSENGYWLKLSPSCLEKEYTISCDKDFTTTLLYKTQDSPTIHVSQNINSEVAQGEAVEKVAYKCFREGTSCTYEGGLWASTALYVLGIDTDPYIPYLASFAEDKKTLFPETFLYILTGSDEYLSVILGTSFKGDFWKVTANGKFYDTALALLSLQSQETPETTSAKEYLLNGKTQNADGCWNNLRDTGFLLYSGWPPITQEGPTRCDDDSDCASGRKCIENQCRTQGGGDECSRDSDCEENEECVGDICVQRPITDCTVQNKYCVPINKCESPAVPFEDLTGCYATQVCCSQDITPSESCLDNSGIICANDEECPSGKRIFGTSDSENECCNVACVEIDQEEDESTCEASGSAFSCKSSCSSEESQIDTLTCELSVQKCCQLKPKSGGSYLWIWLLLGAIILVIIAIIFREKIKIFIFKTKSGFRKGPAPRETRPPFFPPRPPRPGMPGMIPRPRPFFPQPQRPSPVATRSQIQTARSAKDKEFEETLKKLKEMSK
ncbi:hypothetical protein HYW74_00310 [Candidatus Pacearchaeota archaeon]|nr:hypothetical protein [Candidatus Pacearchaeota archaeon]